MEDDLTLDQWIRYRALSLAIESHGHNPAGIRSVFSRAEVYVNYIKEGTKPSEE